MNSEFELIEKIKPFQNILVYGAKDKGRLVVERLKFYSLNSKIHVVISDTNGELIRCAGYLVRNIKNFATMPSCVVLIAAQEIYREEMEKYARNIGFSNIIRISENFFDEMNIRYENTRKIDELIREEKHSRFLQHYTLNQIRLNRLRDKVKNGKRIRVIFLLSSIPRFKLLSVYRALEKKNELFDCFIFCFQGIYSEASNYISGSGLDLDELRLYYERLETEKFNVIWGYDDKKNSIDLETCSPDIVFHCSPYLSSYRLDANLSIDRIVSNYLSCYIIYGINISNRPNYLFDTNCIACSWLNFVDTRQAFNLCAKLAINKGINAILSGWPGLDEYTETIIHSDTSKFQGKALVVYAPHFSIETFNNTSTFHIYHKLFLDMLEKYPDIHFIFKPHPGLGAQILSREGRENATSLRYEDYVAYCNTWEKYPNGSIITDNSYIDLFKKTDCLITDSYSFIVSWLPAEKPCIFLMNPENPDPYGPYFDFIPPVIDSYYICKTAEEIKKTFKEVVIDGNDPKAEERKKQCENVIYNLGHAGEFIADYIERQLKD